MWKRVEMVFVSLVCLYLVSCSQMQELAGTGRLQKEASVSALTYSDYVSIADEPSVGIIKLVRIQGLFPNWSSDGKRIFFISGSGILVADLDKSSLTELGFRKARYGDPFLGGFSLSPDDKRTVMVIEGQGARDIRDIYVLHLDTWAIQRLTKNSGNNNFPVWSPDGKTIGFTSDRDGYSRIYTMDSAAESISMLTRDASDNMKPAFSSDGAKLAFVSFRNGNAEIYVMNRDGSDQRNLTRHPGMDIDPKWSPDSKRIVFSSDRSGNFEIYVMDDDGSNQKRLTRTEEEDAMQPAWSPSGHAIAFSSVDLSSAYLLNR